MRHIPYLLSMKEAVETNTRSGAHFRHSFMSNYNNKYGNFPSIVDTINEGDWYGCIIKDSQLPCNLTITSCEGEMIFISEPNDAKPVEALAFEGNFYLVPETEGTNIYVFASKSGILRGRIGDTYFTNHPILEELAVADKIKGVCDEYKCVILGKITDKGFVATDIMDLGNNTIYSKSISDTIFIHYGLEVEKIVRPWQVPITMDKFGGVVGKVYKEGNLFKYIKKAKQYDVNELSKKINEYLNFHVQKMSPMTNADIFKALNINGEYEYNRELMMKIINDWRNSLKNLSAEDFYLMTNKN